LAIVARIMREHGGEMVIGDSPLGGAGIELIFPAADEEANA
jgi:nitrogen fixation/metabolism regulation signal transduction histidine kinase